MKNIDDKNIYDMLNDIEVDMNEYEREDFNDIEKMKIKKKFRQSIGKKNTKNTYKKYVSVASVALASLVIISVTPLGTYASKIISDLVFDIRSVLRLEANEGNYIKVINKSITKENLTVRLNEAVLNDDELIISMTKISDKKLKNDMRIWNEDSPKLYINGEFVDAYDSTNGVGASKTNIDEVLFFKLGTNKYNGVVDIKVELGDIIIYGEDNEGELVEENVIEGPFTFEFDFDTTKINNNIKNIKMNKVVDFGDDQKIALDKLVYTPLSQKIYYTKNENAFNNEIDIVLKGVDDLGNEVRFDRRNENNGKGELIAETSSDRFDPSAKYLTLTAYKRTYISKGKHSYEEKLEEIEKNIKIDLTNQIK